MKDTELNLRPLTEEEATEIRLFLTNCIIIENPIDKILGQYGILRIGVKGYQQEKELTISEQKGLPYGLYGLMIWSERLMKLDPQQYRARIDQIQPRQPKISITDLRGRFVDNIYPSRIRIIEDAFSGFRVVGNSSYLIKEGDDRLDTNLSMTQQGKTPLYRDNSPFIKITDETIIKGQKLMCLRFGMSMRDEVVVIDPENRSFVSSQVEYPLSFEKWPGSKDFGYLL